MEKWGTGIHGTSQLLEHTFGKIAQPTRMLGLEKRAGLSPGTLSDIYSNDPQKVINSLKNFDNLKERIVINPTDRVILDNGRKEAYWMLCVYSPNEGIGYVSYDGKPQSLMNMELKDFNNQFKD